MIVAYGSYLHADGEVELSISRRAALNDLGLPYQYTETWSMAGMLTAADPTAVAAAVLALNAAYAQHGQNLILYLPDGVTPSSHALYSSSCLGGTRVVDLPSYPQGAGGEHTTYRRYNVTVEADIATGLVGSGLLAWQETVSHQGTGGPREVLLELRQGPPQRQQVSEQTISTVTQSGSAVGLFTYPDVPPPIWPAQEIQSARQITRKSPRYRGIGANRSYTDYEVSWAYSFQSEYLLTGYPSPRQG